MLLLARPPQDYQGTVSPDGRWLDWVSDASGRDEVLIARFPDLGDTVPVSTNGGTDPRWSRDQRELFFGRAVPGWRPTSERQEPDSP